MFHRGGITKLMVELLETAAVLHYTGVSRCGRGLRVRLRLHLLAAEAEGCEGVWSGADAECRCSVVARW